MEIEIVINDSYSDTKVTITSAAMAKDVRRLIDIILNHSRPMLVGYQKPDAFMIDPNDVCRFIGQNKKVYAIIGRQEYALRQRLYELETMLDTNYFMRISQSEIINLRQVQRIDLGHRGEIGFMLANGQFTFTSRNYTERVKQHLNL